MYVNFSPLSTNLIEKGKVERLVLFDSNCFEVSILKLSPGAKIKEHKHHVNNEKCIIVNRKFGKFELKTISVCLRGEKHSVENSTRKTMYVFSIKWPPATYN